MNKQVLCFFIAVLIAAVACQQSIPGFPSYPVIPDVRDPNHPCNRPGANCNIQSRFAEESSVSDNKGNTVKWSQVCDGNKCVENRVVSGSSYTSISFGLLTMAALVAVFKNFSN